VSTPTYTNGSKSRCPETCPSLDRKKSDLESKYGDKICELLKDALGDMLDHAKEEGTYKLREALEECEGELSEANEAIEKKDREITRLESDVEALELKIAVLEAELKELETNP
jgi:chromosome segregation ATPase